MASPKQVRTRAAARRELGSLRSAAGGQRPRAGWPHWTLIVTTIVTLLVATLSAVVSVATARSSADDARALEGRSKKAAIYAAYLTAVRATNGETDRLGTAIGTVLDDSTNLTRVTALAALSQDPSSLNSAAVEFYKQGDQVFVYGSDVAYQIHEQLAQIFQRRIGSVTILLGLPVVASGPVEGAARRDLLADSDTIDALITKFQLVFCAEVSPIPRSGCK